MAVARITAPTMSTLRTAVRQECGDPSVDRSGGTIPAAMLRYSDQEVLDAINNQLVTLGLIANTTHPGQDLLSQDISYPGGGDSTSLGSTIGPSRIYKVEDVTISNTPAEIQYVSPLEANNNAVVDAWYRRLRYFLVGDTSSPFVAIGLRPKPVGGRTIRVWYVASPLILALAADTMPIDPGFIEVVTLGAAMKLLRRDGEATEQQVSQYNKLEMLFLDANQRRAGPDRVRRRRRGYS